jgi:hypothetical protein
MTDDAALFHQLDQVFADILSAMAPAAGCVQRAE